MKKLLRITVIGLFLSGIAIAKTINIENRVQLNVPDNFNYIKIDNYSEYFQEFLEPFGEDANFYYVGTDNSIEFANLLVNDQNELLGPIIKKMNEKNFKTEKSAINFISREMKKLIKKYNYDGVIWVYLSYENLEDVDDELFEIVNKVKNMTKDELNKETIKYKNILKDELELNSVDGLKMKITKFKIERNPMNEPAFDLKLAANMYNINWDMEIYGYLDNKKPVLVGSECIGKCKAIKQVKNKINFSNLISANSLSNKSLNIVDDLNQLNELFKSGALTKEEFEKAKKKLLN